MSIAGLNALKRSCPLRKSIALCERNRSSLLPDVMKSLSKQHVYKHDPSINIDVGHGDSSWNAGLVLWAHSRLK